MTKEELKELIRESIIEQIDIPDTRENYIFEKVVPAIESALSTLLKVKKYADRSYTDLPFEFEELISKLKDMVREYK